MIFNFRLFLQRDGFVKAAESKATQNFLEWFSETSMFNEFIELKLKNSHQHGKIHNAYQHIVYANQVKYSNEKLTFYTIFQVYLSNV